MPMVRRQAKFKRDTQSLETDFGGKQEAEIHYIYNGRLFVMIKVRKKKNNNIALGLKSKAYQKETSQRLI